jgi:flagellar hook-length control protein FliK
MPASPLFNLASLATELSAATPATAPTGVGKRLHALAAKAAKDGPASAGRAETAADGSTGAPPQTFADLLTRLAAPAGKSAAAQAGSAATAQGSATGHASPLALAFNAAAAHAAAAHVAATPQTAAAAAADAAASPAVAQSKAQLSAALEPGATAPAAGAAKAGAGDASAAAKAVATAPDAGAVQGPLAGLAVLLFSGPLQTPLATPEADAKAQTIEREVARLAPNASPAQLTSWSSTLASMTKALDAQEKQATGVDPASPPAGWTEPANFQAARSLLANLSATVAQAQTAKGLTPTATQVAKAAAPELAAFQAATPKLQTPTPQGKATAKLFGETAAPTGAAAAKTQAGATPQAHAQAEARPEPRATARAASAQTAAATSKPAAPNPEPSSRDVQLKADPEPVLAKVPASASPGAGVAASSHPGQAGASSAQAASSDKPLSPTAEAAAAASSSADSSDPTAAAAAAGQAAAGPAASGAPTAQAAAPAAGAPPQAVAYLASALIKQANGGRSTSFNIELHPADLGRVEVKLQIESDGRLAARMSFDNPVAAADFQARSDDLRRSLEQAGFQLSGDSLSFGGQDAQTAGGGSGGAFAGFGGQGGSGRSSAPALADLSTTNMAADAAAPQQKLRAIGLDVRI